MAAQGPSPAFVQKREEVVRDIAVVSPFLFLLFLRSHIEYFIWAGRGYGVGKTRWDGGRERESVCVYGG